MRCLTILAILVGCGKSEPAPSPHAPANESAASTVGSAGSNDTRKVFENTSVALPHGWRELKREPDRVVFRSADDAEQATISKLDFAAAPSFEDFKRICEDRLAAERDASKDISFNVTGPSNEGKQFTFMYSGSEKETQRLFSGYMVLADKTVMTVYLEAIGATPQRHLASFETLVKGFRP